jgi:hypothetical protein
VEEEGGGVGGFDGGEGRLKLVADLTTEELARLVKLAVREELDSRRARSVVKAPTVQAKPSAVAQVRRSLRRQGVG